MVCLTSAAGTWTERVRRPVNLCRTVMRWRLASAATEVTDAAVSVLMTNTGFAEAALASACFTDANSGGAGLRGAWPAVAAFS